MAETLESRLRKLFQQNLSTKEISLIADVAYDTVRQYRTVYNSGFKSVHEYQCGWIKRLGFKSYYEYLNDLAQRRGFESYYQYRNACAKRLGFESYYQYIRYLNNEKQKKKEYREFGKLVKNKLKEMDKDGNWLANQLGITKQAVLMYITSKSIPKKGLLKNLADVLNIDYKTIESVIGNATRNQA